MTTDSFTRACLAAAIPARGPGRGLPRSQTRGRGLQRTRQEVEKLATVDPAERTPYLLKLLTDKPVNGYYQVHLAKSNEKGWIYKSYVRRHPGQHPKYVAYKRTFYKHWIDEDGDCQDTRQEVLIRDASTKVTFQDEQHCKVAKGTWPDPLHQHHLP